MGDISSNTSLIEIVVFGLLAVICLWGYKLYSDCKKDFETDNVRIFVENLGTYEEYMRLYDAYKKWILKLLKKLQCVKITK